MIVILGPTASGKTLLAARVAFEFDGEIISADSRQVYKGMDIGTGKDLGDYLIRKKKIPYHLIDIVEPGYEYNLFEFQRDFLKTHREIAERNKLPVLCGGSGLYIEAVLRGFHLPPVANDPHFENSLRLKPRDELIEMLQRFRPLHNTTDILDEERLIRAIEIAALSQANTNALNSGTHPLSPPFLGREGEVTVYDSYKDRDTGEFIKYIIFGIRIERERLRKRITERLERRLQSGLIEEVQKLLDQGLTPDQLKWYGLEYKFVTLYLRQEITFNEMFRLLNIAIRQYAKRQMTWFRRMERSGFIIHWIDGELEMEQKIKAIKKIVMQGENVV
jgi:tRNA dimethylallyltransferase